MGTFIWDPPIASCSLRLVREIELETDGHYLVDNERKLFFEGVEAVQPPNGCPAETLYRTEYTDLYLTQAEGYLAMNPADVDITLYTDTRMNYLEYNLERKAGVLTDQLEAKV